MSNYHPVEEQQEQLRGGRAITTKPPLANKLNFHDHSHLSVVEANDFLPPVSRWTNWGGLFLTGAIAISVGVASVMEYKVTVKAQAVVRPAGELRLVQSATDGSVINIAVKENQPVKKGDVIAVIDDSQLQTQKSQLQSTIGQAQLQLLQINAQIRALDSQMKAESDRIQRSVASAQAELSRRQREYRDRQINSYTEVKEAQANLKQSQNELLKAQQEIQLMVANLKSAEVTLNMAQSKWERYQLVALEGALSQNQLDEAKLAVEQQKQTVEVQKASLAAHQQVIEQQKQAVESAKARWQRSQTSLNPSSAEVAIASERIAEEKASGTATLAILEKEKEALIQQRIQISKQLERDNHELRQVTLDLGKTTITATADGIISTLQLRNSGQTVRSGEEIAQIVPSNAPLEIKAVVAPQHIGKIAQGQNVQMRVSACPYTDYGTLKGVVSQISEDTIKPETMSANFLSQKGENSNAFYEVTIKPQTLSLSSSNNNCTIQLGMEGRADIISREETVLQFLLRKAKLVADF